MSTEVVARLGIECPSGGSFYVCEDKPVQFLGCCTVDPCKTSTGVCPDDDLRPTSYDEFSHNMLTKQACVSDLPEVQWFTCAAIDVPFMGCCTGSPCAEGGCDRSNMSAAQLSDNAEWASVFLDGDVESPDDSNEGGGGDDDGGLSTGVTVGIAVGAAVAVILLAALGWWFLRRRRQRRQEASQTYEPFATTPGGSRVPNLSAMRSPPDLKPISVSPYSSTFGPSPSPDPRLQQQHMFGGSPHPQQYNQHLHQSEHQNQLGWDASQGHHQNSHSLPAYNSPPLRQATFSPSPYTSGQDVAGYAPALNVALNHGQQQAIPVQELPGGMAPVSELSTSHDDETYANKK